MKQLIVLLAAVLVAAAGYGQYSVQKFEINTTSTNAGSNPAALTEFQGKVYFAATDGVTGRELWWSDGTSYGMAADINPGPANGVQSESMCVAGNRLYFIGIDSAFGKQVYEYDGVNKPKRITEFVNTATWQTGALCTVNRNVYFMVYDATAMYGIWEYRPFGQILRHIPATVLPSLLAPADMAVIGNQIYFTGSTAAGGDQLAAYDVKTEQTKIIEIAAGASDPKPQGFYVYKNTLFFIATENATGTELYMYNGFTSPERITDLRAGTGDAFVYSGSSYGFAGFQNKLVFSANLKGGSEHNLINKDLQTQGHQVLEVPVYNYPISHFATLGQSMFFSFNAGMFVFDGVNKPVNVNTKLIGQTITNASNLLASNGRLFFRSADLTGNNELWVLTDSNTLNIAEVNEEAEVVVYPNPANDIAHLQITLAQPASLGVTLTDMQGRVVYDAGAAQYGAGTHRVTLPLGKFASGIYTYRLTAADGHVLQTGKVEKN